MSSSMKRATIRNSKNGKMNIIDEKRAVKSVAQNNRAKSGKENCLIFGTLLEKDEHYTKILAVCADKASSLGKLRPLMVLLEYSCHGVPWFVATTVLLLSVHLPWHVELLVNLLWGLVIDVIVITILKLMFRRSRPAHNKDDMVGAVTSVDKYSFPSGHATRAAMVSGYFIFHVCDTTRQTIYIVLWSVCVSVSRVALGRHHLIDVMCGYIVGMLEYLLLVYLWVSRETCLRWLESYFSHFHL